MEPPFDTERFTASLEHAKSADGTEVPVWIVEAKDAPRDGDTPTLLYAYGGFGASMTPGFSTLSARWLMAGGRYALACVRGGGEQGEAWHRAAVGPENKPRSFEDTEAVAEHLIASGRTRPGRLGLHGVSNGGLTVTAAAARRPELFAAVVADVPLTDPIGAAEIGFAGAFEGEYGRADADPASLAAMRSWSPAAIVDPERFPPLLVTVGDRDMAPLRSGGYELAAALQAAAPRRPTLVRTLREAGHTGWSRAHRAQHDAESLVFLARSLGLPTEALRPAAPSAPAPRASRARLDELRAIADAHRSEIAGLEREIATLDAEIADRSARVDALLAQKRRFHASAEDARNIAGGIAAAALLGVFGLALKGAIAIGAGVKAYHWHKDLEKVEAEIAAAKRQKTQLEATRARSAEARRRLDGRLDALKKVEAELTRAAPSPPSPRATAAERTLALAAGLDHAQRQVENLAAQLDALRAIRDAAAAQIDGLDALITNLEQEVEALGARNRRVERELLVALFELTLGVAGLGRARRRIPKLVLNAALDGPAALLDRFRAMVGQLGALQQAGGAALIAAADQVIARAREPRPASSEAALEALARQAEAELAAAGG